ERVDERQREVAEVREVGALVVERGGARLVLIGDRRTAERELALEPGKPPAPALLATDHRRVDEEPLPAPWRAQAAGDDRSRVGIGWEMIVRWLRRRPGGEEVVLGRQPARRGVGPLACVGHLREREVLGKAPGRELLGRTGEKREQRAAGRIGPPRPAREECRDGR